MARKTTQGVLESTSVWIPIGRSRVVADLALPLSATGLVIFAHGSGSGRLSPRNQAVAQVLQRRGLATLLADLLTPAEEAIDRLTAEHRFDIGLLGHRLVAFVDWARQQSALAQLPIGLYGASTGAAAALLAAAERPAGIAAVVSRGGRPDLAGQALPNVQAPTLLIVGSLDREVIELNSAAMTEMRCEVSLEIVDGATHLFEEPGTLDRVAQAAGEWFEAHLTRADRQGRDEAAMD